MTRTVGRAFDGGDAGLERVSGPAAADRRGCAASEPGSFDRLAHGINLRPRHRLVQRRAVRLVAPAGDRARRRPTGGLAGGPAAGEAVLAGAVADRDLRTSPALGAGTPGCLSGPRGDGAGAIHRAVRTLPDCRAGR